MNKQQAIYLPCIIEGIATRSDKTIKVVLGTQELDPATAAELFRLHQSMAYVGIKEEMFNHAERDLIEKLEADSVEYQAKTPSQRLRAVMYKMFQQDPQSFADFTRFYEYQMERMISHFKSKLDADL